MRRLLLLAILTEVVYVVAFARPLYVFGRFPGPSTDLLGVMGRTPLTFVWYAGTFVILFLLYLVAYLVARRLPGRAGLLVVACGVIFGATLIFAYPVGSKDFFGYILEGRIFWTHDLNPLVMPRGSVWSDPFRAYTDWAHLSSSYGPAWILLTGIPLYLGGGAGLSVTDGEMVSTFLAFKGLVLCLYVATVVAIYLIVRRIKPEYAAAGALLFAWNPLVLYEIVVNGHNDLAMMAFGAIAIYGAVTRQWWVAFPSLAVCVLMKYTGALLGPPIAVYALICAWQTGWKERAIVAGSALAAFALAVAVIAPFWVGLRTFEVFWGFSDYFIFSVFEFAVRVMLRAGFQPTVAVEWLKPLHFLALGVAYLLILARIRQRPETLLRAAVLCMAAYLLIGAFWFHSWYVIWLVAVAAMLPLSRFAAMGVLFSFTSVLLDAVWLIAWRLGWYGDHISIARGVTVLWVFGPVFVFLLLWGAWASWPYILAAARYWWQMHWWARRGLELTSLTSSFPSISYPDPMRDD